jgi:hypothetical protein
MPLFQTGEQSGLIGKAVGLVVARDGLVGVDPVNGLFDHSPTLQFG